MVFCLGILCGGVDWMVGDSDQVFVIERLYAGAVGQNTVTNTLKALSWPDMTPYFLCSVTYYHHYPELNILRQKIVSK